MLLDLDGLSPYQIEDACANYRRDPANKYFPTPGQIIEAMRGKFEEKPQRLPKYNPDEFHCERAAVLKPIGQVLREHGFERAADKWDARS